jgi:hypothetical protein
MSGKNRDAVNAPGAAAAFAQGMAKLAAPTASEPFVRKRLREIVEGKPAPDRVVLPVVTEPIEKAYLPATA